jgi:hypothetical protein
MVHQEILKDLDLEIKADKKNAQILIKSNRDLRCLEEAKKIIEDSGIRIIETKPFSSNQVLLKLDTKDMRDVALKLTEHGFIIKGINALPEE